MPIHELESIRKHIAVFFARGQSKRGWCSFVESACHGSLDMKCLSWIICVT